MNEATALQVLRDNPTVVKLIEKMVGDATAGLNGADFARMVANIEKFLLNFCRDTSGNRPTLDALLNLEPKVIFEKYISHWIPGTSGHHPHRPGGGCGCNGCLSYAAQVQILLFQRCKQHFDECDIKLINEAALAGAFPLIEDDIVRMDMSFVPTGVTGATTNAEGEASTFIAGFAPGPGVGAGQSILLQQDLNFGLHWRPGCLDPSIVWSEGTDEDNFKFLRFTTYVAWRTATLTNTAYGKKWSKWQIIDGKAFYCGEKCAKVAIDGPTGCAGEVVGREARLLIKIDNIAGANANMVNGSKVKVDFYGRIKPCCDVCGVTGGEKCAVGCGGGMKIVHGH